MVSLVLQLLGQLHELPCPLTGQLGSPFVLPAGVGHEVASCIGLEVFEFDALQMLNLHFLVARACRFTRSPGPPTAGESKAERDTPGGGDPSAGCHLDQGDHHPVFRTDSGPDYGAEKRSSGHAYSNGDDVTEPNKGVVAASRALLGRDNSSGSAESEESDKGGTCQRQWDTLRD